MKIIPGSSNQKLAAQLAESMNLELLKTEVSKFSDGELKVQVHGDITSEIMIIQSTSQPVNDNLMELLLLADTAKRAGAKDIIALIPYFGYARQNMTFHKNSPISVSLVIKMIENAGITKVITLDLHSKQIEGMFNIPITNIDTTDLFLPVINDKQNAIIVSPDIGGIARARNYSNHLNVDLAILNKNRVQNNECIIDGLIGDVKDKDCFIVDDIIDSASTVCLAAELLHTHGARSVNALITHGVLSGNAVDKINQSNIENLYISDSIVLKNNCQKIKIIPIKELILANNKALGSKPDTHIFALKL
ncbi:MAG: ribose-phosphate diphosphokinase [Rickettsiales bacterium]|nr:MAG: ribose-phosphate diphosphokinase [Rickettsiales bacterium]